MSWRDRDYAGDNPSGGYGRPGGDWQGLRPSFDNPASWSVPFLRIAGIDVRIHILFIIFVLVQLLRAGFAQPAEGAGVTVGVAIMFGVMLCLFTIVLLHEFGHAIACRWWGGEANEILMWPLGGLAYCSPPNQWRAHMATAVGGPAVNVLICLVAGPMLGLATGVWLGIALPNPLNIFGPFVHESMAHWTVQALYTIHVMSFVLLLFNLLPMFPLDGGRIVQAGLWSRMGYVASMRIAVRVGYIGAILLAIFGLVWERGGIMIVLIAAFCGFTCWMTQKQLAYTEEMMGHESDDYTLSLYGGNEDEDEEDDKPRKPTWRDRRAQKQAEREREEAKEVDRILDKIAHSGIESLSRREKRILQRESERKRQSR